LVIARDEAITEPSPLMKEKEREEKAAAEGEAGQYQGGGDSSPSAM
jgi:hypothetical protein